MVEHLKNVMVGAGASWVLWLMFGLSVLSVAIMLERIWKWRFVVPSYAGRQSMLFIFPISLEWTGKRGHYRAR